MDKLSRHANHLPFLYSSALCSGTRHHRKYHTREIKGCLDFSLKIMHCSITFVSYKKGHWWGGLKFFLLFYFSWGNFSHLLLRNNNNQYLRETRDVDREEGGGVQLAATLLPEGFFSWEGQSYPEILGWGKELGAASSSLSHSASEETGYSPCWENLPILQASVCYCPLVP